MASNGRAQERHVKLLRRQRGLLVTQLPDLDSLLNTGQLRQHFSQYEQAEILKQRVQSEKAEKFLDVMEYKTLVVYQEFLSVIHKLRPDLAVRLEGVEREVSGGSSASSPASNGSSPQQVANGHRKDVEPVQEVGRGPVEDAGLFGLSGPGSGPAHHLSRLGFSGREFLASRLNGRPPQRQIFHNFCHAMGVENKLVQACSRSGNPTAYLMQQLSGQPDATFAKLEIALNEIGHGDLYQELSYMMENGGMDDEDN